jgi:hypothetical protein
MQLDEQRKGALFNDARVVNSFLKAGQPGKALDVLSQRVSMIEQFGGDPSDSREVADYIANGDIKGAVSLLNDVEKAGVMGGYLNDMNNTGGKSKLGTYNPGDYTVKSWSEFAKYGDPSILERYESDSKNRQMEIRESAQQLKEEKFSLEKQSAELAKNKKEIEIAAKRKDEERAKFLELQDSKTAVSNIKSLLDNDLDLIYGGMEWVLPDKIRTQRGKNMMARRNQVVSSLKLMAAGKLKGQGSITENERTMLAQAATTLQDENIDSNLAREELNRIMPIYDFFITGEKGTVSAPPGNAISDNDLLKKYGGL